MAIGATAEELSGTPKRVISLRRLLEVHCQDTTVGFAYWNYPPSVD